MAFSRTTEPGEVDEDLARTYEEKDRSTGREGSGRSATSGIRGRKGDLPAR